MKPNIALLKSVGLPYSSLLQTSNYSIPFLVAL